MVIPSFHRLPFTWASVGAATTIPCHVYLPAIVSMRESGPEPPKCFRQESVIGRITGHRVVFWASKRPPLPRSSQRGQKEWLEGPS